MFMRNKLVFENLISIESEYINLHRLIKSNFCKNYTHTQTSKTNKKTFVKKPLYMNLHPKKKKTDVDMSLSSPTQRLALSFNFKYTSLKYIYGSP